MKTLKGSQTFERTQDGTRVISTLDYELPEQIEGETIDKTEVQEEFNFYSEKSAEWAKAFLEDDR